MPLTAAQRQAICADGNVLVLAGAGAGKTKTLVERCCARLLDPAAPASLEQMLLVTFTEAAAAELKQRIRIRLMEQREREPSNAHLQQQLAILDTAAIGTLHSYCLRLVREHFHLLEIDPQSVVMSDAQRELLLEESLDSLFEEQYATASAGILHRLIQIQGRGRDVQLRQLLKRVHAHTQTLASPAEWFCLQEQAFRQEHPAQWMTWLLEGLEKWRDFWLPILKSQPADSVPAVRSAEWLEQLPANVLRQPGSDSLQRLSDALSGIGHLDESGWPSGKKIALRKPLRHFFDEAIFFKTFFDAGRHDDGQRVSLRALEEDWRWAREEMLGFLQLARTFTTRFTEAKRQMGLLDFQDLEQLALRLLRQKGERTPLAQKLRDHFHFVFVDEYQDINEAQDAILKAVGGDDTAGNRFLVGDVKQSIYRFRLANPSIFQRYRAAWEENPASGKVIRLVENFRSREALLGFVNALFSELLQTGGGSVPYEERDYLRFGAPAERRALSLAETGAPRTELHWLIQGSEPNGTGAPADASSGDKTDSDSLEELTAAEKEAAWIAQRLSELRAQQHSIWDESIHSQRPIDWRDMVILLRSPRAVADLYAKIFARAQIPLHLGRGGFFQCAEMSDLVSVLMLLDNPLQDIPLLAALRSPLGNLSLDELAQIRAAHKQGPFWIALRRWQDQNKSVPPPPLNSKSVASRPPLVEKIGQFLNRLTRWRRLARHASLTQQLDAILAESNYPDWIATQPRAEERRRNLSQLFALAEQFDPFQRQGVPRFLKFIDLQQSLESKAEPLPYDGSNAVRLLSIHQSKGLEFPLVALAGLGRRFNFRDFAAPFILDEKFGLCPQIQPPDSGRFYPSLPFWLARQREKQERIQEEIRLLYVAMTRARDTLLLSGAISKRQFADCQALSKLTPLRILSASSAIQWLVSWCASQTPDAATAPSGSTALFHWQIRSAESIAIPPVRPAKRGSAPEAVDLAAWRKLAESLSFTYPFLAAAREPAKGSVSSMSRKMQSTEEAALWAGPLQAKGRSIHSPALSAVEIGIAHHAFLQSLALTNRAKLSKSFLAQEAERMQSEQLLTPAEAESLDLDAIAAFWESAVGGLILGGPGQLHREIPFTVRLTREDLLAVTPCDSNPAQKASSSGSFGFDPGLLPENEFIVLQGIVDLAVILPEEIWILDFKTDAVTPGDLPAKTRQHQFQLQLYALALGRIYHRPITQLWLHFLMARRTISLRG